ncbi:MAG: OmpA family protein [Chlorobi bacterium]|nr:OmpA family protein [Chlorobiota bacterium]
MTLRANVTFLFFFMAISFACSSAFAQKYSTPNVSVGVYGGVNYTLYQADFKDLPGYPSCCSSFNKGDGYNPAFGLAVDIPIGSVVSLLPRIGYRGTSGTLRQTNSLGPVLTPRGPEEAFVEHTLDARLESFMFDFFVKVKPWSIPLAITVGPTFGYTFQRSFVQLEQLTTPTDVYFNNGARVRNQMEGDIPNAFSYYGGLGFGIRSEIPLWSTLRLEPSAGIILPVTQVTPSVTWYAIPIQASLSLFYRFPEKAPVKVAPPPPPPPAPPLSIAISAFSVDTSGRRSRFVTITVEEIIKSELFPILPYIFFDHFSSDLRKTSLRLMSPVELGKFNEKEVSTDALKVYADLLNIVCTRMKAHPGARLTITGYRDPTEAGRGYATISRLRATAVRDYLTGCGVPSKQITVLARRLPDQVPDPRTPEGQAEARRVELSSDTYEILAPVRREEIQTVLRTPTIVFQPFVNARLPIRQWKLEVTRNGEVVKEYSGFGQPPEELPWDLDPRTAPQGEEPFIASFRVEDEGGQEKLLKTTLPVSQKTISRMKIEKRGNQRIDRFRLILFKFGKADIGPNNRRILDVVKKAITPRSTVTISGYTDRIGDPKYNLELARRRCEAVVRALGNAVRPDQVRINPVGSAKLLYDNSIPEGRNFCRTVHILVETPAE